MRKAVVEYLLAHRAALSDCLFVIAILTQDFELIQRAKVRNLRDALCVHLFLEQLNIAARLFGDDLKLIQMERGFDFVIAQILRDQSVAGGKALCQIFGRAAARFDNLVDSGNLELQAQTLNLGGGEVGCDERAVLAADGGDVIQPVRDMLAEIRAKEARAAHLGQEFCHVGTQDAALAKGGDVLDLVERERAKIADCAELAVLILAAKGVRRVLKDDNIVLLGQRHDRIHIDWIAANVDGDDHLRLVGDLFLHVLGIHIQRQRIDIRKHQLAADGERICHGRRKSDGGDDDLVAGLQPGVLAGDLKARGAVGEEGRALGV